MNTSRFFAILGPGMLVAATGVGTGDLATGSFAGSMLGLAILWAVLVGALLKFIVTEGIARWQLATGTSVLEGVARHLGRAPMLIFLPYLILWSFFTASAMMSGCGVTLHALIPVFDDAAHGKIFFGTLSSLLGAGLVFAGGYRLFEKIMTVCILLMFGTVVVTAVLLWPGADVVLKGIFLPSIPDFSGSGLTWTVALIGGIGGTVTILSYGYWIREEGRTSGDDLTVCRIDLGSGYLMTAIFGMSVVIIGSNIEISGSGATLIVDMAEQLSTAVGPFGRWLFLIGAVGAVFSSLLGTWQATPYIFADSWRLFRAPPQLGAAEQTAENPGTSSPLYRYYLIGLALVPILGLFVSFREVQKLYAVTGAFFVPMLALALILLNSRSKWVGAKFQNRAVTTIALSVTVAFFLWIAITKLLP
jgi:Mn2+/Fe2+ NRAMP family transporter